MECLILVKKILSPIILFKNEIKVTDIYINVRKSGILPYIKIFYYETAAHYPETGTLKFYFDLKDIVKILGINLYVDSINNILTISQEPGLNKHAKQKKYIIDTDFNVVLKDLYVKSLELFNSPIVQYQYIRGIDTIAIVNSKQLQALTTDDVNLGKIITKKLIVDCQHLDNRNGKLKAFEFDVNAKTIINCNGKI